MCVANGNEMSADGAVGGLRLFVVFGHFLLMRTTVSDGWDVPWMRESQPHVYGLRRSIVKAKPAKTTKIALYRSTQTTLFLSPAPLTWTRLLLRCGCCCCCWPVAVVVPLSLRNAVERPSGNGLFSLIPESKPAPGVLVSL